MERVDEYGRWKIENGVELLVYPSDKWILENQTKSPQQIKKDRKQEIEQQLERLDKKSIRDSEDILDALVKKGLLVEDDVEFVKARNIEKKTLRQELKGLE